mmetsp:Transcript_7623/g.12154  ORF Transcript_7623/g.12154 Transcript_7623/m.12154 type:complete len:201 (-) Transcript_7623:1043-1645(-)
MVEKAFNVMVNFAKNGLSYTFFICATSSLALLSSSFSFKYSVVFCWRSPLSFKASFFDCSAASLYLMTSSFSFKTSFEGLISSRLINRLTASDALSTSTNTFMSASSHGSSLICCDTISSSLDLIIALWVRRSATQPLVIMLEANARLSRELDSRVESSFTCEIRFPSFASVLDWMPAKTARLVSSKSPAMMFTASSTTS